MSNLECQMSIFDFLNDDKKQEDISILLNKGQRVFLVNKADVIPATVLDETWICGENNRGYRLIKENGCYGCAWNNKILGKEIFTDLESAEQKAADFLKTHKGVILVKDIKPIKTVAYSYIRDCDKREMIAFYCELENGMYYIKEFMTYHHICIGNKAIKKFMEQKDFKYSNPKEIDYIPKFKNMYRCSEQSDWDYAEAEYSCSVG